MKIQFWGVRGSVPAPVTPMQIQSKISAIIQRISPKDVISPEAKEKFISTIPDWQFGTSGGNTPCISITTDDGFQIVLDCGTGIRCYGKSLSQDASSEFHIFISHFHWDHIQGLPFFDQAFLPKTVLNFYSFSENAEQILRNQMIQPYFPVTFDSFTKNVNFKSLSHGSSFYIGNTQIFCCKMSHPGSSFSYTFIENSKKFVYATDVELSDCDYTEDAEHINSFKDADVIVLDSQYTVEEANRKVNWGHSAFCSAIDFAVHWNIKKIYLYHHEPSYDDKKLNSILLSARWYAKYIVHSKIEVYLSTENTEITLKD